MWLFGLVFLVIGSIASLTWAARVLSIGARDARDLAAKLAVPHPVSAIDWPELRLDEVVGDPGESHRVILVGRWPAHPEPQALLVLELDPPLRRARRLLERWCDEYTAISPSWSSDARVLLRRRRTDEALEARMIAETTLTPTRGR